MQSAFHGTTIYEAYDFIGSYTHALVVHANPDVAQSPALSAGRRSQADMQAFSERSAVFITAALPDGVCSQTLPVEGFLALALGYTLPACFSAEQESRLMEQLVEQLTQALAHIREDLQIRLNLSVSALHPNTQNVYDACLEALSIAVHFPFVQDPAQIILYASFHAWFSAAAMEEKEHLEEQWSTYMSAKNYVDAEEVLLRIVDLRASAPLTVTSLTQELLGRMHYAVYRLCDTAAPLPGVTEHLLRTVEAIHSAKTLEELHQRIHSIYQEMAQVRDSAARPATWSWPRRIAAFVQNNYADPTLNASTLSRRFGLNLAYLSHIFHEGTGIKLLDYIHSTRISHIKHLLRDTNMTLSDIASKTGYYDRYAMSRVFTRYVGMPPSAYRRESGTAPQKGPS